MNSYEQRQTDKKERLENAAVKRHADAQARLARVKAMGDCIPFGQPVIGQRDRNYRERMHRAEGVAWRTEDEAKALEAKAAAIGTGGIASDDPEAVVKLKAELAAIEAKIKNMKEVNKRFKAGNFTEAEGLAMAKLKAVCPWERLPYPAYSITNAGANRRRIEKRIEALTITNAAEPIAMQGAGWTLTEDRDEGRFILTFAERLPEAEYRVCRGAGFVWSPSRKAFVRKITPQAVRPVKWYAEKLPK